jgi:hypothetical protein
VRRLGLKNVKVLIGVFPEETGHRVAHREFRFYIDVDVYQSAADVVEWVWPRLVAGGMIVYSDYGFRGCEGVIRFVNEQRLKPDQLILHNLNGHAIAIKTAHQVEQHTRRFSRELSKSTRESSTNQTSRQSHSPRPPVAERPVPASAEVSDQKKMRPFISGSSEPRTEN